MSDINQEFLTTLLAHSSMSDPIKYRNVLLASKSKPIEELRLILPKLKENLDVFNDYCKRTKDLKRHINGDDYARRRKEAKNVFNGLDQQQDSRIPNIDAVSLVGFHCESIFNILTVLVQGAELICNSKMVSFAESATYLNNLNDNFYNSISSATENDIRILSNEQKINQGAQISFAQGVSLIEKVPKMYEAYLMGMARNYEYYYEKLRHRHNDGVAICNIDNAPAVALTDMAIMIWENIDKMGEIESGSSRNEISAYTINRAYAMIEASKSSFIWSWLVNPGNNLIQWVSESSKYMQNYLDMIIDIKKSLGESTWSLNQINIVKTAKDFDDIIRSLDLSQITCKLSDKQLSKSEKFMMDHRNKSIKSVAELLVLGGNIDVIVDDILKSKIEERNYFMNENSFYVCKIGTGNMFTGEAPGSLEVIPGEKPHADLKNIWGEGFPEIKDFINGMEEAKRWQPLFLATSPSGSTDKSNILLVGPMGCGKTLCMKAVGSAGNNISVFATSASFGTSWANMTNRQPKELFEASLKLHRASGRPVYILIDEIDSILHEDRNTGSMNLSNEFQNLMDGVVSYPGITLIGATNHPQRIPPAILRRFAKVMVVGELSLEDRIFTIKHYLQTYLPCENFSEDDFIGWANKLEGATGDSIRKVIDQIWLELMRKFIAEYKDTAEELLKFIDTEYGDKFDISQLSVEHREQIKSTVGKHLFVTKEKVSEFIEKHLSNFAIQQQIAVAKKVYQDARDLLKKQKSGIKSLGFSG